MKVKRYDERVPDEKPKGLAVKARHQGAELHPQDDAGSACLSQGFSRKARGALLLSRGLEPRLQRPTGTLCAADARVQEVRRRTPRSLRRRSLESSGIFKRSQSELPPPLRLRPEGGHLPDVRGLHRTQRRVGAGTVRDRSEGDNPLELPLAGWITNSARADSPLRSVK